LAAELWSDEHQASAGHPWRGRLVAFTGESRFRIRGIQLDREAQQFLATKAGCKTWPRVTKQVEVCIVSDPENETGNLRKAEQYDLELGSSPRSWCNRSSRLIVQLASSSGVTSSLLAASIAAMVSGRK
jgi:hypothetical protein